ncbi:hypothetical protein EMN47_16615 [Prolixibacteraceae bacterium JC049]|nr:hypothetical protein [Prolixibacteraceae bacterium JC049]
MLYEVFRFEIRRAFQRPTIYLYWLLLFSISFLLINAAAGAFKSFKINFVGDNVFINSPGIIDIIMGLYSYLGIFVVAAICSNIVFKDFAYNTLELTFSTPLKKHQYILGRFFAAFILSIVVFTGISIGFYAATLMPYLKESMFGPNEWATYIMPYLNRIIPNLFLVCAIFFALSLLLRNVVVNWISIIILYALYAVSMSIFQDIDNQTLASLLDPFGIAASIQVTSSASASDMNESGAQLVDVFLYNRLLWVGIGLFFMGLTFLLFRFNYQTRQLRFFLRKKQTTTGSDTTSEDVSPSQQLPLFNQNNIPWKQLLQLTRFEIKKLFQNVYFLLITLIAIIMLFVVSKGVGKMYDTNTYPVTYQMLQVLGGSMKLLLFIIIMIFSGEMIWRDRDTNSFEISNTYPIPKWVTLMSKYVALTIGVFFLFLILIGCGVINQAMAGYHHYELPLYLKWVFGVLMVDYLLLIALAFFIHVIINNKYVGYVILILYWIFDNYLAYKVLKHHLLVFGGAPGVSYSDMNEFGFNFPVYWIFKLYWVVIAAILLIATNQLLVTQTEDHWKIRLQLFINRFKSNALKPTIILTAIALSYGGYIFFQTNIRNEFTTSYQNELQRVAYELDYKQYENMIQPKITDVKIKADLYPNRGDFIATGTYCLQNRSNKTIDTLIVNSNKYLSSVSIKGNTKIIHNNEDQNITIYHLAEGLKPGAELEMSFTFEGVNNGFAHSGSKNFCRKNGTFIYNSYFPTLGYSSKGELQNKRTREKHDLPERSIVRSVDDPKGLETNFITEGADFINFEAIVSTSSDQTALTPGKLINQWTEKGRNYFHYQSEKPMLNYYAILSGRYEIRKETWTPEDSTLQPVEINLFYHKKHDYNLDNMIKGVKQSLSTYSRIYTPYQYGQLNIVEFPRYSSYAQSFPNLIPFSEGIGFIADLRKLDDESLAFDKQPIDYPFFVTTHEMAHQWWAHQVVAADVEGAQMLMESITQFSALMCMKDYYGSDKMRKFFKNEMHRYILSRKNENIAERPLGKVAHYQSSTYYNKGALVMHSLYNYLGEELFIAEIKKFIQKYAFQPAPYPTAKELVDNLKTAAPDSLKYLVEDHLEKITFYNWEADSTEYKRNKNFTYTVNTTIDLEKYYADGQGKKQDTTCDDYIEIGAYNSKNKLLYLEKVKLKKGVNHLTLQMKRKPSYLVIDPNYLLMSDDFLRKRINIARKQQT